MEDAGLYPNIWDKDDEDLVDELIEGKFRITSKVLETSIEGSRAGGHAYYDLLRGHDD